MYQDPLKMGNINQLVSEDLFNSYLARTGYHSHHLATIFAENGLDYEIFLSWQHNDFIM